LKYWDSSALVPLFVQEPESGKRNTMLEADRAVATWWGTRVECASALARLQRTGEVDAAGSAAAQASLEMLAAEWTEVPPSEDLRRTALRLLRVHPLRAADALQLAAAIAVSRGDPSTLTFLCSYGQLAAAAEKEGFAVG
jgi:uncharacterized protein